MAVPRVAVVGVGGIGGIVTGRLALHPDRVLVVACTTNDTVRRAVVERGLTVVGVDGTTTTSRAPCVTSFDGLAPFDVVVLATRPAEVEAAARSIVGALAPDGVVVCLQNGLCEERVEAIVGGGRVLGGVVAWGASMPEPGRFVRTARGGMVVGWPDGQSDVVLGEVAAILGLVAPVATTHNLRGVRWSKLAMNCAVSTLGTVGGTTLGALLVRRDVRRMALELLTEACLVAELEGVELEKVAGTVDLGMLVLTPADRRGPGLRLAGKHALVLAVGARYRRMRSSLLGALERNRPVGIEFLNGEIVARGLRHVAPVPWNQAACQVLREIEAGALRPGDDALAALERIASGTV